MAVASDIVRVTVDLPARVVSRDAQALAERLRILVVLDKVRAGRITRVTAAQALGMALDAFLRVAGEHGVYAIDYDADELEQELRSVEQMELWQSR